LERVIACGNLGLDGGLRPLGNVAALARLLREEHFSSAILPWSGSEVLEETGRGGGFLHLENVIAFLRGHGTSVRKPKTNPETQPPPPDRIWSRIEGQEVGKRLIEVAAAGLHHVLLPGPVSARADLLAHALSSLFPALNDSEAEEVRSIYALAGMESSCPSRPFFTFASSAGLPPLLADRRLAKVEEILLAHRGVLYVDQVCEKESLLFPAILPSMRYGKLQVRMGARRVEIPVSPLVVASGPVCGCGASGDSRRACTCRPTEVRRYRERWRKLLRQPFDLYLPIREERSRRAQVSWQECHDRVGEARLRMQSRQGKANGYLAEEELFGLHPWKEETLSLWRALDFRSGGESGRSLSLARVALTICDLRAGKCVEPADFFEARHYQGDGYLEGEETGRRAATGSGIEPNSTAIP
jgi:magnesium chelatase family protein